MNKKEILLGKFYGYKREVEYEISEMIRKGVESLFLITLPPHSVDLDLHEKIGIGRFIFNFLDEKKEVVFANSVDVELKSKDYIFKIVEDKNIEVDYSIKSCRVTSNERFIDNEYHAAQLQVASFIMSENQSEMVRDYIKDISIQLRDRLVERNIKLEILKD